MRKRGNGKAPGKMGFIHMRHIMSTAVCGARGVHTTKKLHEVTCEMCDRDERKNRKKRKKGDQ